MQVPKGTTIASLIFRGVLSSVRKIDVIDSMSQLDNQNPSPYIMNI